MLEKLLKQLEENIPFHEYENLRVSKVNVGWHVEHCLIAMVSITDALSKSNPADYEPRINLARFILLKAGRFPRGRAKAPQQGLPSGIVNAESLRTHCADAKVKTRELDAIAANHFFHHPYLGNLNVKRAKRFLIIHTQHHLKIIRDILA